MNHSPSKISLALLLLVILNVVIFLAIRPTPAVDSPKETPTVETSPVGIVENTEAPAPPPPVPDTTPVPAPATAPTTETAPAPPTELASSAAPEPVARPPRAEPVEPPRQPAPEATENLTAHIVTTTVAEPGSRPRNDARSASETRLRLTSAPDTPARLPQTETSNILTCMHWEGLSPEQSRQLSALLTRAGIKPRPLTASTPNRWRVRIPPLKSYAEARNFATELARMGISRNRIYIDDEPPNENEISFGSFDDEAEAQHQLQQLRSLGVASAQIITIGSLTRHILEASADPAKLNKAIRGNNWAMRYTACQ